MLNWIECRLIIGSVVVTTFLGLCVDSGIAIEEKAVPLTQHNIWRAKPPPKEASTKPTHVRIVDYGDDIAWNYQDHFFRGSNEAYKIAYDIDVDGDGKTDDDSVGYFEFSLTDPFVPVFPTYDIEATSSRIYGGGVVYVGNNQKPIVAEYAVNVDHAFQDDLTWMSGKHHTKPNERTREYAVWIWKKEDFLNGGDEYSVTFEDESWIAVHISRYWVGYEEGRFIVRDGDQFYISETTWAGCDNDPGGGTHKLQPRQSKWSPYNPKAPYHIDFDKDNAKFKDHTFTDVTAVGFYVGKDSLKPSEIWLKWTAFECEAMVARPSRASEHLDMALITGEKDEVSNQSLSDFYISKTEIPYMLWQKIHRWGRSSQFATEPGYVFDADGDMGSMDLGKEPHGPSEPVTDITWLDAVAWCNAFSEYEGKTPCYYLDAEYKKVFRNVIDRSFPDSTIAPVVYVNWNADGYRLPTPTEWVAAAGKSYLASEANGKNKDSRSDLNASSWTTRNSNGTTHPVGTTVSNKNGLYDMVGNVWEWCWDIKDACDTASIDSHLALGGGIEFPDDPETVSASPYGDEPYAGSYNVGLRVVRVESGGQKPSFGEDVASVPSWRIKRGVRTSALATKPDWDGIETVKIDKSSYDIHGEDYKVTLSPFFLGKSEVTYSQWLHVLQWAEVNGYEIDRDGDLGSMDFETGEHAHSPNEPVTQISWYDALVWCNALSEMEGKLPVYCVDPERTKVLKQSIRYRFPQLQVSEMLLYSRRNPRSEIAVFVRWHADGYRLPTEPEWELAQRAGREADDWYGVTNDGKDAWLWDNSAGTTHPVGKLGANLYGLHDMIGNVFEWCWGSVPSFYDRFNPKSTNDKDFKEVVAGAVRGVSFKNSIRLESGRQFRSTPFCAYPEIGFRIARCDAGVHPEKEKPEEIIVMDVDTSQEPDLLQGQVFRSNIHRTGHYLGKGPTRLKGKKWSFETNGPVRSSPVVVDGTLFIGSNDGNFYAVNAKTGAEKWRFKTKKPIVSSGAVVGKLVIFGSKNGKLYALDRSTGEERWSYSHEEGKEIRSAPAVAYGAVFFGTLGYGTAGARAVNIQNGELVGRFRGMKFYRNISPLIAEGRLIGASNFYLCYDIRSGKSLRSIPKAGSPQTTPAYKDGVLYATGQYTYGFSCVAADINKQQEQHPDRALEIWEYKTGTKKEPISKIETAPAVAEGLVFFGSNNGNLYAVDEKTGEEKWRFKAKKAVQSDPSVAGGIVYFGSNDKHLYAVKLDGTLAWKFATGGSIHSSPFIRDGMVFVGSDDGKVYALH